ncbi:adhesion G-protein coupled receptor F1-like [Scyliorhinus canicula]|uniref:adhesion G-protein coupled receptor F1-like n=1 Tax=Scyliorhinus canicula TaxID=7830 RepID=UPI0018F3DEF0|nr:adhesion G-protein coupled receptor F1-like [Scyliorhinus canicula]
MMARHKIMLHYLLLLLISQCAEVEVGRQRSSNSPLLAEETSLTEDSNIQIHLNRQKRNVNQLHEYELDVALNLTDSALKLFLEGLQYPIQVSVDNYTINITDITLTTVCRHLNNETQCRCDDGFIWNSTFCGKYQSCSVNITEDRSCDCIRDEPTEGTYCDLPTVATTPTQSTVPTTIPRNTTMPITVSTIPTTVSTITSLNTQVNRERQNYAVTVSELSFTDDLNNSSSSLYQKLSNEFKILLQDAYKKVQPGAEVTILGFTKGSLIILHEVATTRTLTNEEISSQIQNLSPRYTTKLLLGDKIPCQDKTYGITNYNTIAEIPCQNQAGVMKRRCGKNGKYEGELDFCVSKEINNILKEVNSTNLETIFSNLLQQLSNATNVVNISTPGNVEAVVTILTLISNVNATVNETDMEVRNNI